MLPEQKKSPQEIHALRGKLGVPIVVPMDEPEANKPVVKLKPAPLEDLDPIPDPVRDPITRLPVHRHSDDQLDRIRRRGMFETQDQALKLPVRRERTTIVISGYLFASSAAVPVYHNLPMIVPIAIALLSLAFGAYLFFLRPYSKHHGAFIGMVVLFVLTYAVLQYFPQLRHAT